MPVGIEVTLATVAALRRGGTKYQQTGTTIGDEFHLMAGAARAIPLEIRMILVIIRTIQTWPPELQVVNLRDYPDRRRSVSFGNDPFNLDSHFLRSRIHPLLRKVWQKYFPNPAVRADDLSVALSRTCVRGVDPAGLQKSGPANRAAGG